MSLPYQLTIDCRNPSSQVTFWALALGYEPKPPPTGHATWNDWYRSVGVPDEELDLTGDSQDRLRIRTVSAPTSGSSRYPSPSR